MATSSCSKRWAPIPCRRARRSMAIIRTRGRSSVDPLGVYPLLKNGPRQARRLPTYQTLSAVRQHWRRTMAASQKLSQLLELADQGPALRAALAEEVAELLTHWPADYPESMWEVCEALLAK